MDLTNTLSLWKLGIVKSQRRLTPGSYLSTFKALSAVWLTSHKSKVEHKKKCCTFALGYPLHALAACTAHHLSPVTEASEALALPLFL